MTFEKIFAISGSILLIGATIIISLLMLIVIAFLIKYIFNIFKSNE